MRAKVNFKRNAFFRIFLWAGLLFAGFSAIAQTPYNIVMNIFGDPTTQMAFNWFTTSNTTDEQVQIAIGIVTNHNLFTPVRTVDATTNQKTHKAVVSGLSPGTTYSFRVGKTGAWSEIIGTFTTAKANKDPFSFIYVTDSHDNVYPDVLSFRNVLPTNSTAVLNNCPNADFWLHCGDLMLEAENNVNDNLEILKYFISSQQNMFLNKPFAPVMGNHDDYHNHFGLHFNLNSTPFDSKGSTYTYIYGDAQFFAINSQMHNNLAYIDALYNWMRAEVSAHPGTKWRIVYFHIDTYSGADGGMPHQEAPDVTQWRKAVTPLFDELNIDIAFYGHGHVYQVIGPVYNKQLVPCSVSNVQQGTPNHPANETGKSGGIFDVNEGTLYFCNNYFGAYGFNPIPLNSMIYPTNSDIPDYPSLFTGRLGQNGNSTYSNVSVSTDAIVITTYQIVNGISVLLDEIRVIKDDLDDIMITTSQTWNTNRTVSNNIIIPGGVTLTITATAYFSTNRIKVKCGGHLIVSGGIIDDGNVVVQGGGKLTISNNGKIVLGNNDELDIQLGAEFDLEYGEVSLK